MEFIVLDFETADSYRDSPCEIGLTFVKEGKITDTRSWLIKPACYPYFDEFNTYLHGIEPEMVKDAPEFPELWKEISLLLENQVVFAHNASFDMSVLRWTLDRYQLEYPSVRYCCSYILSKKVWTGAPAYDLKSLCRQHGIPLGHHRAGPDSYATAQLALLAFEISEITAIEDISNRLNINLGQLYAGGYDACGNKRVYDKNKNDVSRFIGDPAKHNTESIFYRKTVVFTGKLSSMQRNEAHQKIVDIGGFIESSVKGSVDYLVVGQQDYRVVGEDGLSSKQEKAIKMAQKGIPIEIVSEVDFLRNL